MVVRIINQCLTSEQMVSGENTIVHKRILFVETLYCNNIFLFSYKIGIILGSHFLGPHINDPDSCVADCVLDLGAISI